MMTSVTGKGGLGDDSMTNASFDAGVPTSGACGGDTFDPTASKDENAETAPANTDAATASDPTEAPIVIGDVVRLKSCAVRMTIVGDSGDYLECAWFEYGKLREWSFPRAALTTSDASDEIPF